MHRIRRCFVRAAPVVCVLLVAPVPPAPEVRASEWTPKAPPSIYDPTAGPNAVRRTDFITDVCATDAQLDCVESIAARIGNTWVAGSATETLDGTSRLWEIPGIVNLNGTTRVAVTHRHNYTGNLFLTTEIAGARTVERPGYVDANSLPRDIAFRATIRTSWVLPTHVATKGTDATVTVTRLPTSGASRVTLSSIPATHMLVLDDKALTSPTGKGSDDIRFFSMTVSDGRFYPIKKDCIEKSSIMTGENGYGFSLPTFKDGNLDLQVKSPHFRSDGVTKHIGVYESFIPIETAQCLWGDSIGSASKFTVEVIETDGATKTATTSVNVGNDGVVIKASGFTFSTPTVRVKPVVTTPSATETTAGSPGRPTGVRSVSGKGTATISFTRVKGLTYRAVAVNGKIRKVLRCSLGATRVTCRASRLAKGRWTFTVTPLSGSTVGATYSKTLAVK